MTNRNLVDNEPTVKWTAKASVFTDLFHSGRASVHMEREHRCQGTALCGGDLE